MIRTSGRRAATHHVYAAEQTGRSGMCDETLATKVWETNNDGFNEHIFATLQK